MPRRAKIASPLSLYRRVAHKCASESRGAASGESGCFVVQLARLAPPHFGASAESAYRLAVSAAVPGMAHATLSS